MLSLGERHGLRQASPATLRQEWFWQVRSSWSTLLPSGKRSSRWWWWVPVHEQVAGGTLLCAMPGLTLDTCYASALGCLGRLPLFSS